MWTGTDDCITCAGDYPLSATIASEYSSSKWRGAFVASVFAMQVRAHTFLALLVLCHSHQNLSLTDSHILLEFGLHCLRKPYFLLRLLLTFFCREPYFLLRLFKVTLLPFEITFH